MKAVFVTGVRLIGLLMIFWGLWQTPEVVSSLIGWWHMPYPSDTATWKSGWEPSPKILLVVSSQCVFSLMCGILLLFCGERVASCLATPNAIPAVPMDDERPCADDMLVLGIRLIGIYVFLQSWPDLLKSALLLVPSSWAPDRQLIVSQCILSLAKCLLASGMAFYPLAVANLVKGKEEDVPLLKAALEREFGLERNSEERNAE